MKRLKIKALLGTLAAVCVLGLSGCGQTTEAPAGSTTEGTTESVSVSSQESSEESSEQSSKESTEQSTEASRTQESSTEASSAEETKESSSATTNNVVEIGKYTVKLFDIPENEGTNFVKELKVGWNLGNTFEAFDCTWLSNEMDYESAWVGAKTTPELIDELKAAGFQTIRIPVSWHNHLSDKENYIISEQWLDRVNEVIDYCIDRDMYVILNIHHDNSEQYFYPSKAYMDRSEKYISSIWTQLANRFKDYDHHLLMEAMNEPRLVGHANEWWIDKTNADCQDAFACINRLNQLFVDTVRATGGYNATRYLLCPGYDAAAEGALLEEYVLPTDPVDNDHHIIVAVHAYTPYSFALDYPGTDTWSSDNQKNKSEVVTFMNNLYKKYVAEGTPVLIDEFGSRNKNYNTESRVDLAGFFVANAKARGMSCLWWDNNVVNGDGECFGIIDRRTAKWTFPEIKDALIQYTAW